MKISLFPKCILRIVAKWIVRDNIRRIVSGSDVQQLFKKFYYSRELRAEVLGAELSVSAETAVPALLALIPAFRYNTVELRVAVRLLGITGYSPTVAKISAYLSDPGMKQRIEGLGDFTGNLGPRLWAAPILVQAARSERNVQLRAAAIDRLLEISCYHETELLDSKELRQLLSASDLGSRVAIVRHLAVRKNQAEEGIKLLLEDLPGEREPSIRTAILEALLAKPLLAEIAVPILIESMDSKLAAEGVLAIKTLAAYGPRAKTAVPRLTLELLGSDQKRAKLARLALSNIGVESTEASAQSEEQRSGSEFRLLGLFDGSRGLKTGIKTYSLVCIPAE